MGKGNRAMNWNSLFDEEQGETSADGRRGRHQQTRSGMGNAGDEDGDERDQTIEEILHLHNSDHPGMVLVAAPLTGSNFLNWSRSIKRALGAKSKLELLDGTLVEPDPESKYYKRWLKVDYMISSWIINSISKDLVNSFTHFDTSKKLWEALNRRFNRSNGAKIAKLEKEIRNYEQGNQSVTEYFNNLTMLWNEMSMILPPVECVCAVATVLEKREEDRKLVQFMLGLNEIFEHTRSQILLMDPLPSLDKAYAMITQVEDEKSMTEIGVEGKPQMALYMQKQGGYRGNQGRNYQEKGPNWQERGSSWDRRLSKEEKARLKCTTCKQSGHEAHECFKTHGVPEWYKRYKEQRGNARVNYMAEGMEDDMSERSHSEKYEHKPVGANFGHLDIANIIQVEMAKCLGQMTSRNGNEGSHRIT